MNEQSNDTFVALTARRAPYLYSETRTEDSEYNRLIEYMMFCTVLRNPRITKNQLGGLFRNLYLIPEGVTKSAVDRMLNTPISEASPDFVLCLDKVKHGHGDTIRIAEHLRLHDSLSSYQQLCELYAPYVSDNELLQNFKPELYHKPPLERNGLSESDTVDA